MRDPNRIKPMLAEIERLWMTAPDCRLGQIVANAMIQLDQHSNCDPFYIEDEKLIEGIRKQFAVAHSGYGASEDRNSNG